MVETSKGLWWIGIIILVAITAFALYKMLILKESAYILFSIASALSGSILRQLPLLVKYKYLNAIPAAGAFILLVLAVLEALKK